MADSYHVRLVDGWVRPDGAAALAELLTHVFSRRSIAHLKGWHGQWQQRDLARSLAARSPVFAAMLEAEPATPPPYGLAYFRVTGSPERPALDVVADPLPTEAPERLARVLGAFLMPGAEVWFITSDGTSRGWRVADGGEVVAASGA